MNVIIHTPRVFIEEWNVPRLPLGAGDNAILDIVRGGVRGVTARRASAYMVDTGPPVVFSRGPGDLTSVGRRIAAARAAERAAIDEAAPLAKQEIAAGASERSVAAELGIDRNTLRAWLGKPRST